MDNVDSPWVLASVCEIEAYLKELDGVGKELKRKSSAVLPLINQVKPKLIRLEELKSIRKLLLKLQDVRMVHDRLNKLFKSKNGKQSDEEGKIIESAELFNNLAKEWKSLASVQDDNRFKRYLKEIIIYWNKIIRDKVETIFVSILDDVNWGNLETNPTAESAPSSLPSEKLLRFKQYFSILLTLDLKPLFYEEFYGNTDCINLFDTSYISLPLELMIVPFKKRFVYHFMTNQKTNQLSKPEWYHSEVMRWIRDNEDFLNDHVEPLNESNKKFIPVELQFICALIDQTGQKLRQDLPKLAENEHLFSHVFDETLQFERELIDSYNRYSDVLHENCNLLSLFAVEPYFNRLMNIERRRSMAYLETIISSPSAYNPLISPYDEEDVEDFIIPEVADNFILMLQAMTDRLSYLAKKSHRYAFIDLELKMLADFHLRLTQVYRSLENKGGNDWPPDNKFFSIMNAFNYVEAVLKCWESEKIFADMSEFSQEESILQDTIKTYQHMINEMTNRLIRSLMNSLLEMLTAYSDLRWNNLSPFDDTHQYVSYRLFYSVSKALNLLKRKLSSKLSEGVNAIYAEELNNFILRKVILSHEFNIEGSKILHLDLSVHLCSVFKVYIPTPESFFEKVIEASKILVMDRATSLRLKEALKYQDSSKSLNLNQFSLEILTSKQILEILSKKRYS